MVDKEHAALSGASLHEPKGIAAAAANRVYLSNGAASGSWTTVPSAAIDAAGVKVFQSQLYHVRNELSSGTAGATLTDGTWNTRVLNTEKTDELTITLSGNQFTLPAGTYWCQGSATTNFNGFCLRDTSITWRSKLRLRNITGGTTLIYGLSEMGNHQVGGDNANFTPGHSLHTTISGRFTLGGNTAIELQNYVDGVNFNTLTIREGVALSSGENEVYADLMIWKTA